MEMFSTAWSQGLVGRPWAFVLALREGLRSFLGLLFFEEGSQQEGWPVIVNGKRRVFVLCFLNCLAGDVYKKKFINRLHDVRNKDFDEG